MFIFRIKRNESTITNKENILFLEPDKGLTLLLRIFIGDGKSGLRSSFLKIVCLDVWYFYLILKIFYFFSFEKFWYF